MPAYEIAPDGQSIKCLGCGRTSYSRDDVQHRYCGACGYHGVDPSINFIADFAAPIRRPSPPTTGNRRR